MGGECVKFEGQNFKPKAMQSIQLIQIGNYLQKIIKSSGLN
jgi:hypothetical protein